MHYCSTCRGKWEEEQRKEKEAETKERERKAARQRERRAQLKDFFNRHPKPVECPGCQKTFRPKRADATYCSAACRQRVHRTRDSKSVPAQSIRDHAERVIEATFRANPDNAYTTEDLCDRAFSGANRIERKHRAAVVLAATAVCMRLGERWAGVRAEGRGGMAVYFNRTSVMSYGMMRLKTDPINGYRPKPGSWRWRNPRTEDDLRALIASGGRDHKYVVEGGAWWQHCQEDIAKFKNVTVRQAVVGADLPIRDTAEAS